ncbi:MAG: glycoside hydrolase family 13 protein [Actinobacteria bacterium]|nr:glycoside hydrolase family 13 protein [Actinomycetota bacterium]
MLTAHHDGSALYVSNRAPRLGEKVTLSVRVPKKDSARKLFVRILQDGEPVIYPMKKVKNTKVESWWQVKVEIVSPSTNYRFLLRNDREFRWLNAIGVFESDVVDHFDFKIVARNDAPAWLSKAVFYQIFPDRFAKSGVTRELPEWAIPRQWNEIPALNNRETGQEFYGGDFTGVEEKLDHLSSIGVTSIYFTPIFASRSNHRYDASSFETADPLLGGDEALISLRKAAQARGIRVMSDLTTNHCGLGHPWIQKALSDPNSDTREFFYWSPKSKWGYVGWWNVKSLPKLNFTSKKLRGLMWENQDSIVRRWLREPFGMSGWRIDVGNMTGRYYGNNYNREIAQSMRNAMEETNPDTWLVAENGDFFAEDLDGFGWHGTMNYNGFTKPIWYWINSGDKKIRDSFGMPAPLPKIDGEAMVSMMRQFAGGIPWRSLVASMILLGSHDRARFQTIVGKDVDKNVAGMTLLMTYPGVPSVFAGDEIGLEGYWGENGRRTIPWDRPDRWNVDLLYNYIDLIQLRKTSDALINGGIRWIDIDKDSVAYLRESKKETLLVFVSRKGVAKNIDISKFGYSITETLFGPEKSGKKLRISSKKAVSGIWRLK